MFTFTSNLSSVMLLQYLVRLDFIQHSQGQHLELNSHFRSFLQVAKGTISQKQYQNDPLPSKNSRR